METDAKFESKHHKHDVRAENFLFDDVKSFPDKFPGALVVLSPLRKTKDRWDFRKYLRPGLAFLVIKEKRPLNEEKP